MTDKRKRYTIESCSYPRHGDSCRRG